MRVKGRRVGEKPNQPAAHGPLHPVRWDHVTGLSRRREIFGYRRAILGALLRRGVWSRRDTFFRWLGRPVCCLGRHFGRRRAGGQQESAYTDGQEQTSRHIQPPIQPITSTRQPVRPGKPNHK